MFFKFLKLGLVVWIKGSLALAAGGFSDAAIQRKSGLGFTTTEVANKVVVTSLVALSAPAQKGLKVDDQIIKINKVTVSSENDLYLEVDKIFEGAETTLIVKRPGEMTPRQFFYKADPIYREVYPETKTIYTSINVGGKKRRAILTLPTAASTHRAVLLMGGIGCYSIDPGYSAPDAYLETVSQLANARIATIRVEKAGQGESDKQSCLAESFKGETQTYIEAARAFKNDSRFQGYKLILFGHSMGGVSAPIVATQLDIAPILSHIVVFGTLGRTWIEYQIENVRRQETLSGASNSSVEKSVADTKFVLNELFVKLVPPDVLSQNYPGLQDTIEGNIYQNLTYMLEVSSLKPKELWSKVPHPTLIIRGDSDFVTSNEEGDAILAAVPNPKSKFEKILNLDHFFFSEVSETSSFANAQNGFQNQEIQKSLFKEVIPFVLAD